MQKITPFLWFNDNAQQAVEFYVSIFANSKILNVSRSGPDGGWRSANFQLEGQEFMALNGGPVYSFTPAISLFVSCETQPEVDALWAKLSAGGAGHRCGWLKDKFGLSWQIIPTTLGRLLFDEDPEKAQRVLQAMLKMEKIEIAELERAYAGE
jgi:predicted 3-demethylubiquinone-9 3-methyltransferase (glyoxalase superfamily)